MANTWHHDRARFHPWDNPKSSHRILEKFREERWWYFINGERVEGRRTFSYVDYSKAGPRWYRRMFVERPARRQANMKSAALRNRWWYTFSPCRIAQEGRVPGWLHCAGCCEDALIVDEQGYDVWPWPQHKKPQRYYW